MQTTTRASLTLSSPSTMDLRCALADRSVASVIEGRQFVRAGGVWRYPVRKRVLEQLKASFPRLDVDSAIGDRLGELEARDRRVRALKDAGWEDAVPVSPMPIMTKPYRHQVLAYNLCMELLG